MTRICKGCPAEFETKRGRRGAPPQYCEPCRKKRKATDGHDRVPRPATGTCLVCKRPFRLTLKGPGRAPLRCERHR